MICKHTSLITFLNDPNVILLHSKIFPSIALYHLQFN